MTKSPLMHFNKFKSLLLDIVASLSSNGHGLDTKTLHEIAILMMLKFMSCDEVISQDYHKDYGNFNANSVDWGYLLIDGHCIWRTDALLIGSILHDHR